jgi:quinol monooxygenase YgiN
MYGTVARLRLKPGTEQQLQEQFKGYERLGVPGYVRSTVYRMDKNSNEFIMAVVFEDRDSYHKNAQDPAQDVRYQEMRALLESDPEWNDGEIVYDG